MKKLLILCLVLSSQISFAAMMSLSCDSGSKIELDFESHLGFFDNERIEFETTEGRCCPRCNPCSQVIIMKPSAYHFGGLTFAKLKEVYNGYALSGSYHRPARAGAQDHPFTGSCQIDL